MKSSTSSNQNNQNKSEHKDEMKQIAVFSHTKILTDHQGIQLWSDPRIYNDAEYRSNALQTYSAKIASKKSNIKAADQLYDQLRSATDTFIANHKNNFALDYKDNQYKVDFTIKPIYAQAFIPIKVGAKLIAKNKFQDIIPKDTVHRYLQLFKWIQDNDVSNEECASYNQQKNLRDNMCTLYYRMYEEDENGDYIYDHITSPKVPSENGALFGTIGSFEPISTSDEGLSFMYLFLRDFVLGEHRYERAPQKIISTKVVSTGENTKKELAEHDMEDYLLEFDVYQETGDNTALPKSIYNEDGFEVAEHWNSVIHAYGDAYNKAIKTVLSSQYAQMHSLSSIDNKDYDVVCQNSYVNTKLTPLRQLICQDLIQLSKLVLGSRHEEHADGAYESRSDYDFSSSALMMTQNDVDDKHDEL